MEGRIEREKGKGYTTKVNCHPPLSQDAMDNSKHVCPYDHTVAAPYNADNSVLNPYVSSTHADSEIGLPSSSRTLAIDKFVARCLSPDRAFSPGVSAK